jgi:hypothetical protein
VDWFERLTGFREAGYKETQDRLEVHGEHLRSRVNERAYRIGELELVSLATLRERVAGSGHTRGRLTVRNVSGDVRTLHRDPAFSGALFQVASQFNLLEMVGPSITPEMGVTRYAGDPTQGPACAIAAGAATIYRNYFAPVGGQIGQTADRQLDGLADLGDALARALGRPRETLWSMRNGYALPSAEGLAAIDAHLAGCEVHALDRYRSLLRIGVHSGVEATDAPLEPRPLVSQAFCSALPVAYAALPARLWARFATLVLEAAYEATLLAALLNGERGGSRTVLLTRLGGGAFGNEDGWIDGAMRRALEGLRDRSLDVRLVSYGAPPEPMRALEQAFA